MSAIIETFIMCDKCCTNYGVDNRFLSAKQHRESARTEGWSYARGKDTCPDCRNKSKQKITNPIIHD